VDLDFTCQELSTDILIIKFVCVVVEIRFFCEADHTGSLQSCKYTKERRQEEEECPNCGVEPPSIGKESIIMFKKRVAADDVNAIMAFASCYENGKGGLPQDHEKAFELYQRAATLGSAKALYFLGHSYIRGDIVEQDWKRQ